MSEGTAVSKRAALLVTKYLESLPEHIRVDNVEDDADYQLQDVDLLWSRIGSKRPLKVEVKGDRHYYTGNFFLETISNDRKLDPGCFIYSEADVFAYCFVDQLELHLLPMPETRRWLLQHWDEFDTKPTSTPSQAGDTAYYTLGKPVPRSRVLSEVYGCVTVDLTALAKKHNLV